ncbi:MAG: hypothetical protein P4N41_14380 [Negativicutes bacterium]|nr:hypothetical protein [Negativicutes bacterium]
MKRMRGILAILVLVTVWSCAWTAAFASETAKDTPYFTRLGGYDALKDNYKTGLYDTYKLWTENGAMTVEGKVWSTTYSVRHGASPTSDLDIVRFYSSEVSKKDGTIVFDDRDDAGRRDISGKFVNSKQKLVWVEVVAWNGGDDYRITVIETR